jgi:hypothetical protein
MSVNLEWDVPHTLTSPAGDVDMNQPGFLLDDGVTHAWYLLRANPYTIIPALRATRDDLSQADGTSLQTPYISGLVASLYVEYWVSGAGLDCPDEPACGSQLRQMDEFLTLNLNALRKQSATPDGSQRLLWQPTGVVGRRMLTQILVAQWMDPVPFDAGGGTGMAVTFAVATPFPYALDEDAVNYDIGDGGDMLIPNDGNADYSPVILLAGSSSSFAITNEDTGEVVSYVGPDAVAGTGEIDFFTANISSFGTDLIADLDPTVTTFFTIPPGGADIAVDGIDMTVVSRAAWL